MNHPHCGNCDYDLTGIDDNRCPECGKRFIEAGITIAGSVAHSGQRRRLAILLVLLFGIGVGVALSVNGYLRTRMAREKAVAQQQADIARRQAAMIQNESIKLQDALMLQRAKDRQREIDEALSANADEQSVRGFNLLPTIDHSTKDMVDWLQLINVQPANHSHLQFDGAVKKEDYAKPLIEFEKAMESLPAGRSAME